MLSLCRQITKPKFNTYLGSGLMPVPITRRIRCWYPVHTRRKKSRCRCPISSSNTGVVPIWTGSRWHLPLKSCWDLQQSTIQRLFAKHLGEAPGKIFSICEGWSLTLCKNRHRHNIRTTDSPTRYTKLVPHYLAASRHKAHAGNLARTLLLAWYGRSSHRVSTHLRHLPNVQDYSSQKTLDITQQKLQVEAQ